MPTSTVIIDVAADGQAKIAPWEVDWGREDMDGDGKPGATLTVSGTFCSGDVYVSSQSHYTVERAQLDSNGLSGELQVVEKQQILGASGLCLRAMAGDSSETQRGTLAYRRFRRAPPASRWLASPGQSRRRRRLTSRSSESELLRGQPLGQPRSCTSITSTGPGLRARTARARARPGRPGC